MARHSYPAERRRGIVRLAAVTTSVAALVGLSAISAQSVHAAGVLTSTTTVAASPGSSNLGDAVKLTATVKVPNLPGLGATPTGTVRFTDGGTLGSAKIGICLLKTCTATLTTRALPLGDTTVTATYSGDTLAKPSSGSTVVGVFSPVATTTAQCLTPHPLCATTPISNTVSTGFSEPAIDHTTTTVQVTAGASTSPETVEASLIITGAADVPQCPGFIVDSSVPWTMFSNTAANATKTVTVTIEGNEANDIRNGFGGRYLGCYTSQKPFKGGIQGGDGLVYGNAPKVTTPSGTYYQAELWACDRTTPINTTPCFDYSDASTFGQTVRYVVTITVHTPAGDPKYVPR